MPRLLGALVIALFAAALWFSNAAQDRAPIRHRIFSIGRAPEIESEVPEEDRRIAQRYRLVATLCVLSGAAIAFVWAILS